MSVSSGFTDRGSSEDAPISSEEEGENDLFTLNAKVSSGAPADTVVVATYAQDGVVQYVVLGPHCPVYLMEDRKFQPTAPVTFITKNVVLLSMWDTAMLPPSEAHAWLHSPGEWRDVTHCASENDVQCVLDAVEKTRIKPQQSPPPAPSCCLL
jgi:hypothetical protein